MYQVRSWAILLAAIVLLSYHLQGVESRFSFALPGKWGHNKRTGPFRFSLPGKWGNHKRSDSMNTVNCEDPDTIYSMLELLQQEALRLNQCLVLGQAVSNEVDSIDNVMTSPNKKQ